MAGAPLPPEDRAIIERYYQNLLERHRGGWGAVDYGRASSQQRKFQVLAEIVVPSGASVLDVGCGLGDFHDFLRDAGWLGLYVGYDLVPVMIEAARTKRPSVTFEVKDILAEEGGERFDYVFANGIFYIKTSDNWGLMQRLIRCMFELCKLGVAFNTLSTLADIRNPGEFYADPTEVIRFCLSLTRRVVLRHDYMPHDFSVYLYKQAFPEGELATVARVASPPPKERAPA